MHRLTPNRPFIWAHRGASKYEPENTLPAFRLAIEIGADGIEMDTFLTADGALLITHEGTITVGGRNVSILALSQEEIQALPSGTNFPTFPEVLAEFQPRGVPISIDVRDIATVRALIMLVQEQDAFELVEMCVDVPCYVHKVREISESATIVFSPNVGWSNEETPALLQKYLPKFAASRVKAVNLHWKFYVTHPELVALIHTCDQMLAYAWDVHTHRAMEATTLAGLDAVYTNYPDRFKAFRDAQLIE